jgi:hypothetical protein
MPSGNATWQVSKEMKQRGYEQRSAELILSKSKCTAPGYTHTQPAHKAVCMQHTHSESPKGKVELSTREARANHIKPFPQ